METQATQRHSGEAPFRSLSERAYQHIRGEILRGRLAVGTVVGESALAEELGISKTPVRQALQLLRGEGLLQVGARRQLVVRGFSPEHRQEIVDVRQALEALAVGGAAERMTLDDIDHLRLLLIRQKRAADAEREDDFIELDEEFHLRIAAGAGMPVVERLLRQLRGFVRVMHIGTTRPRGYLEHVLAEHTAIVDALEERDAARAADALGEHLRRSDYGVEKRGLTPFFPAAAFPQRRSGPAPMRRRPLGPILGSVRALSPRPVKLRASDEHPGRRGRSPDHGLPAPWARG